MKLKKLLLLLFIIPVIELYSQDTAFTKEIKEFKKKDSIEPPPQHSILFIGSSSFTKWTDVQSYFPSYNIINRGFGGSTLPDVIRFADSVIFPYQPKQIVIYCGDNDLASLIPVSSRKVYKRFKQLFYLIRERMSDVNILYVSIKPSPSRKRLMPKMQQANHLIQHFLQHKPNTAFADVYHPMLTADGKPKPELFTQDSLHMNEKGYALWQTVLQPYLVK